MSDDHQAETYRTFRSHWIPRTTRGRLLLIFFGVMYLMVEWPILELANTIEPLILGLPYLFVWLSGVYLLLALGLLYAAIKKL